VAPYVVADDAGLFDAEPPPERLGQVACSPIEYS
jgi:hypothetical protein